MPVNREWGVEMNVKAFTIVVLGLLNGAVASAQIAATRTMNFTRWYGLQHICNHFGRH